MINPKKICILLCTLLCYGCGKIDTAKPTDDNKSDITHLHSFNKDEVEISPSIERYDFVTASSYGNAVSLEGLLPGATVGTWYIITIDGIEYYYGDYGMQPESIPQQLGYSIIDDTHILNNGISVGMTRDEVLELYPNLAIMDFEGNFIYERVDGCLGWNSATYPRSPQNTDDSWEYENIDYYWTNQFDYVMIGNIETDTADDAPYYLGLLVKDNKISAITFYFPTYG